jgi:hypothetical protein
LKKKAAQYLESERAVALLVSFATVFLIAFESMGWLGFPVAGKLL